MGALPFKRLNESLIYLYIRQNGHTFQVKFMWFSTKGPVAENNSIIIVYVLKYEFKLISTRFLLQMSLYNSRFEAFLLLP